jgi:hypothetical protein
LADALRPLGIVGRPIVGWVDSRGGVILADGSPTLDWFVAADDRWYHPSREAAVRQSDVEGLPVISTRMRVPGGDIVHTVWCAAGSDARPIVVVDVLNDSPMPVAVAFSRSDLSVSRPIAARADESTWPAPGLELPETPTVMPIGHRAAVRVCVGRNVDLSKLPDREAVVRGWETIRDRSSRLVLPDQSGGRSLADRVARAKSDIVLTAGRDDAPWRDADSLSIWLLEQIHAHRLGASVVEADDVANAIERVISRSKRSGLDEIRSAAIRCGAMWLTSVEPSVEADVDRFASRKLGLAASDIFSHPRLTVDSELSGAPLITAVEESLAVWLGGDSIRLCADGIEAERLGSPFEGHGLPAPWSTSVSLAIRWHGANAAVLWETSGDRRFTLTSGVDRRWRNDASVGEALWRPETTSMNPLAVPDTSIDISRGESPESPSFS